MKSVLVSCSFLTKLYSTVFLNISSLDNSFLTNKYITNGVMLTMINYIQVNLVECGITYMYLIRTTQVVEEH